MNREVLAITIAGLHSPIVVGGESVEKTNLVECHGRRVISYGATRFCVTKFIDPTHDQINTFDDPVFRLRATFI